MTLTSGRASRPDVGATRQTNTNTNTTRRDVHHDTNVRMDQGDWDAAAEDSARRTEDRWQADLETQEQDDDTYWAAYDAAEDRALDILHGIA